MVSLEVQDIVEKITEEAPVSTREQMINSAINVIDINIRYSKTPRWKLFNALRELNQKRIKEDREIKKRKKKSKLLTDIGSSSRWKCPHCSKEVHRLTSAHVGERASDIINKVLNENTNEKDIDILDKKVQEAHKNVKIVVCCDKCNKRLED